MTEFYILIFLDYCSLLFCSFHFHFTLFFLQLNKNFLYCHVSQMIFSVTPRLFFLLQGYLIAELFGILYTIFFFITPRFRAQSHGKYNGWLRITGKLSVRGSESDHLLLLKLIKRVLCGGGATIHYTAYSTHSV